MLFVFISTEKDNYEPCAGDAMRKCVNSLQTKYEQKVFKNWFIMGKAYNECIEAGAKTCRAAILRHFLTNYEAVMKHLREDRWKWKL